MLQSRTIIIGPTLDEKSYNLVIAQLIFLQQQDPSQDISLWINSDKKVQQIGTICRYTDARISVRLEDEFWRIRTDTGELADAEHDALRAYLDEKLQDRND